MVAEPSLPTYARGAATAAAVHARASTRLTVGKLRMSIHPKRAMVEPIVTDFAGGIMRRMPRRTLAPRLAAAARSAACVALVSAGAAQAQDAVEPLGSVVVT